MIPLFFPFFFLFFSRIDETKLICSRGLKLSWLGSVVFWWWYEKKKNGWARVNNEKSGVDETNTVFFILFFCLGKKELGRDFFFPHHITSLFSTAVVRVFRSSSHLISIDLHCFISRIGSPTLGWSLSLSRSVWWGMGGGNRVEVW